MLRITLFLFFSLPLFLTQVQTARALDCPLSMAELSNEGAAYAALKNMNPGLADIVADVASGPKQQAVLIRLATNKKPFNALGFMNALARHQAEIRYLPGASSGREGVQNLVVTGTKLGFNAFY